MAAPSLPCLKPVGEFGADLEGFLEHVEDFRSYTMMKDRMDSIKRAMHKSMPGPATNNEPKLKANYDPQPEPDLSKNFNPSLSLTLK